MCTSILMKSKDVYFGRNLDVNQAYNQEVVISPRNYCFNFSKEASQDNHYAIIGMATIIDNYPLYADAANEKGLAIAGLNFPDNAHYFDVLPTGYNVSAYEFIPWILCKCESLAEVKKLLKNVTITNTPFSSSMGLTPLHWMISDKSGSIVVESMSDGLKIIDNPIDVLTNNPPFEYHLQNLNNYMHLTSTPPKNTFTQKTKLVSYGAGMGAIGLPGDSSPSSRFIRAAFNLSNSVCDITEASCVTQFMHILNSVAMVKGTVEIKEKDYDITLYSSCINLTSGVYYYKNYFNNEIIKIDMHTKDLTSNSLISFPWNMNQSFSEL